jgi:glycosyltransferase involved in cell wall biosynthesis
MQYSIVIPIYKESESILPLYHALRHTMDRLKQPYEIIFIDDGSGEDLQQACAMMDARLARIIRLPEHIGQAGALAKGFQEAKGEYIISMDGDLQDDPKYIPSFIDKLAQGFDAVCGYRIRRKDPKIKLLYSKIGNFLQRTLLSTRIRDISCTYRACRKECIKSIKLARENYNIYIPFLLLRRGYRLAEIPIEQNKRAFGRSRYSYMKILGVINSFIRLTMDILKGAV